MKPHFRRHCAKHQLSSSTCQQVYITLLGDSTKGYKLVSISYKLGQQSHSHSNFETNEESPPCTLASSVAWSLDYSPPRKHIQHFSPSIIIITLNICNLLLRVTAYTCTCLSFAGAHVVGTLNCCGPAGGVYDAPNVEV
jgi:hypothetical protein